MTSSEDEHLVQAQRHVGEAEQRVAQQRRLIAQLAADGHDTAEAEKFLETLIQALAAMREHLQLIQAERRAHDRPV